MIAVRRRVVAQVATFAAVLATACLDDRPVEPNDQLNGPTVRLGINATINNAQAGQTVRIRAFYRRKDDTDVTLPSTPTSVDVTPGEPKTVAVVVRIADCLADPQQLGGSSTQCAVGITLTLVDENGTPIDEQTTPPTPPLPPGSTTTLTEIVFAPVAQVAFGTVPVLRVGDVRTLIASALDGQGRAITTRKIKWSSDSPNILTIDATTGSVTGVAVGSAKVTATAGTRSATATVRVIRRVASVFLSPNPAPPVVAATSLPLVLSVKAADGTDAGNLGDRDIAWSVVNPDGATRTANVSTTGTVTGVYPGNADVTVSVDGVSKTLRVVVTAAGLRIQAPTTMFAGAKASLTATTVDANNAPLANVPVAWSTSNPSVATIDANGVLTAVAVGSVQVTATGGGSSAKATVRVISRVATIVLSPDPARVVAATSLQLVATPKAADGSDAGDLANRTITWSVTSEPGTARATVSATGLVTGLYPGNADVTVSIDGVTKTLRVVVTAASLRIDSPTTSAAPGTKVQLTAVVLDANGAPLANVPVTWSTSNSNIATVDANGVLTALGDGFVTITATGGGVSGTTSIHVSSLISQSMMSGPSPRN